MRGVGACICLDVCSVYIVCFLFQAEDGIRDLVRSRGLGDVYKRQVSRTLDCTFAVTVVNTRYLSSFVSISELTASLWNLSLIHI